MGEIWPFNAFVMLSKPFSKRWLIKSSMTCEYIQPEVKKMIQQQWLQLQTTNDACIGWWDENWWRKNDTFNSRRYKFIKEDFFGGEN